MDTFAFFIWPGVLLGGLIVYGLFMSRRPKTKEQRDAEDAARVRELIHEMMALEKRMERIEQIDKLLESERVIFKGPTIRTGVFVRPKQRPEFLRPPLVFHNP